LCDICAISYNQIFLSKVSKLLKVVLFYYIIFGHLL